MSQMSIISDSMECETSQCFLVFPPYLQFSLHVGKMSSVFTQIKILKETSQLFLTLKSLKPSSRLSFSGTDSRWSKATRVLWKRKHMEIKHYKKFINTLRTQQLKFICTAAISSSSCRLRKSNTNI